MFGGIIESWIRFNHNDYSQKKHFWWLDGIMHVWGLSPSQQVHVFGQVCHALIRGDFWCPWLGQGFQYLGLEVQLPLVAIEGGWQVQDDILGNWSSWGGLSKPITIFAIWFEEYPYRISMGDGLGVGRTWFRQVLYWWHYRFQFDVRRSQASFVGGI
jgi:hypothetical protein